MRAVPTIRPVSADQTLYLLYLPPEADLPAPLDLHGDGYRLHHGLYLIRSALTQSKLYHRIKWQLAKDTPLAVATLDQAPKFKGMEAGALAWLRGQA